MDSDKTCVQKQIKILCKIRVIIDLRNIVCIQLINMQCIWFKMNPITTHIYVAKQIYK